MATDQEIVVQLNMLYRSELAAGMKADQVVMAETQAQLRGIGVASTQAAAGERVAGAEARSAAGDMGEMGAASRIASGNMDAMGVAALVTKGNIALLAAAVGAYTVYEGAKLQSLLTETRNNTTQTDAQFGEMRATILKLGQESPASLQSLADGYRQISDTGYQSAAATTLLTMAMKSAVSTGANTADVAAALASVMHAFGASAAEAGHYMDVLHLAANEGRLTLQDLTSVMGVLGSYASAIGVPVEDVAAALATMTRNGMDASSAGTQVKDVLVHIVAPGKAARAELDLLSKTTGVDLVRDFSQAGLQAKGLFGVMGDLKSATGGNVTEMQKLIPNMRGLLAEMVLTGKGADDYKKILDDLNKAQGQTEAAYARSQKTLDFWLGTVHNQLVITAADWGQKALPAIQAYIHFVESYAIPEFHALAWAITGVADKVVGAADKMNNFGQVVGGWGNALNSVIPISDAFTSSVLRDAQAQALATEKTKEHATAIYHLGQVANAIGAGSNYGLTFATGPMGLGPAPGTGAPVSVGPLPQLNYLQDAIKAASAEVTKWRDVVAYDHNVLHTDNAAHDAALREAVAHYTSLNKQMTDLGNLGLPKTTAALSLHSAKLDALTRATEAQQKAANAITADIEAGRPITDAQRKAYADATAEVNRMQKALSDIVAPAVALKNALPNVSLAVSELNFFATAVHGAVDPLNLLADAAYKASQYMLPGPYGRPGDIGTNPELQHPSPPIRPYGEDVTGTLGPGGGRPAFGPGATGAYSFTTGFPNAQITLTAPATVNMDRSTLLAGGGAGLGAVGTPGGGTNVGGMGVIEQMAPPAPGTPIDRNALIAAFGPLVSQFQSAMSSSNAVNAAHLQVLQQEGAQQVQLLSTQVTLTQDLTGEISALSSLQQAQGQGAITAITDQTTIFQAISAGQVQAIKDSQTIQADIASGNTAKLAQDSQIASIDQYLVRDAIGIAQEQAAIDRSASQTAILLAGDNLKAAQDKTLVDSANAQAQAKLMGAQLLVAQDNERLVIDGNKLSYDMLQTLVSIDQSLPGQKDFGSMLHDDMAAMSRDNAALLSDQGLVGQLTNAANILAQNGQQTLAYDAQQTAIDAANGASQKLRLELTLAGLKQQEARDQSVLNVLQASYQVQSQLLASTQATNTALIDYVRTLQDENRNLRDPGAHQVTVLPGLPGSGHPVGMRALLSSR